MSATNNKLKSLKIPMLAVHAMDDPILHVDTYPTNIVEHGTLSENLVVLITRTGGHVGWPVGLMPWVRRWIFQNTIAAEFIEAIAKDLKCQGSDTMHDASDAAQSLSEMLFF